MLNSILESVANAYGSMEDPKWSFVEPRYRSQPYASIVASLSQDFSVTETTDLNDDVCVALVCATAQNTFGVNLSLVGPYAMCVIANEGVNKIMTCSGKYPDEAKPIFDLLLANRIVALDEEVLETEVSFGKADCGNDAALVPLRHILFSTLL